MSSINWQRYGPSAAFYLTLASLCLYVGGYLCLVNRLMCPGSFGALPCPQYSTNRHLDGFFCEFYSPIHQLDWKIRKDFWAYKPNPDLPNDSEISQQEGD